MTKPKLPKIICFCGPKGSGKDSAARRLFAAGALGWGRFLHFNYAHPLKEGMKGLFYMTDRDLEVPHLKEETMDRPPHVVPREAITWLAKAVRAKYGDDYFAQLWKWRVQMQFMKDPEHDITTIICTDLRHPPELQVIKELREEGFGVDIVYIENRTVEMKAGIGRMNGDPLWCDDSEAHHELLKQEATHILPNNSSLNDLYAQVDNIYPKVYREPTNVNV